MASFAFSKESSTLVKPASIHGDSPPALAVKICEPKTYSFTAKFGPWSGPSCCGPKQAVSVATISLPQSATVISDEKKLHIDVTGCQQALPTLSIEASQHPVKGSFVWSVVRRMTPLGPFRKHPDPAVPVAGPGSPHLEPAVLMLSAKHAAGSYKPGSYAKFNQTITVKRTTPSYEGKKHSFEVSPLVCPVQSSTCLGRKLHLRLRWSGSAFTGKFFLQPRKFFLQDSCLVTPGCVRAGGAGVPMQACFHTRTASTDAAWLCPAALRGGWRTCAQRSLYSCCSCH